MKAPGGGSWEGEKRGRDQDTSTVGSQCPDRGSEKEESRATITGGGPLKCVDGGIVFDRSREHREDAGVDR